MRTVGGFKLGIRKGNEMGNLVAENNDQILIQEIMAFKYNMKYRTDSDILADLCFYEQNKYFTDINILITG